MYHIHVHVYACSQVSLTYSFIEMPRAVPRPLPYASQTNLYDDHWMAKQQKGRVDFQASIHDCISCVHVHAGFARWLNHILTPVDEYGQVMPRAEGAGESWSIALTAIYSLLVQLCNLYSVHDFFKLC